ncbi:hypothetical protein H7I87_03015 [Mycobacterium timonense]|uniref:Uncharacterized protein n=1 Tax=Mycobacterium bouchedurhonense TaxID=701041 RepID=A0AAW5SA93_MYCBC|nr:MULTISPECIES: hypothetical protein [Mycobacterium avium complex (MAC)]MCV6991880.1 hypothetical protein [Mycobacterium bouchedurhonense]MCV6993701.1 hypothetical protein [Mycobacterium timonense]MDV3306919.1 hypothetical protein [Mycobacterium avium subsp. hominissuis]
MADSLTAPHWVRFEQLREKGHEPQAPAFVFANFDFVVQGVHCEACAQTRQRWRDGVNNAVQEHVSPHSGDDRHCVE